MAPRSERHLPTSLTLRTYRVGFGDCFLLTFHYPDDARHVLIDCGSVAFPKSRGSKGAKGKSPLLRIAEDIRAECGGKLHAIIATHRHRDHIAGFETRKDGRGPGDILRACDPDVVVQPWTEDPEVSLSPRERAGVRAPSPAQLFIRALSDMHHVADSVLAESRRMRTDVQKNVRQQLEFLGEDNLRNASAVRNLMSMGRRQIYVHAGGESGLESVLPGVKVHVLGPPTLEQSGEIRRRRSFDESEFWHLQATAAPPTTRRPKALFKGAVDLRTQPAPPEARWFIPRVRNLRGESLLELVRVLDATVNNTSLVLLFEVGAKKLLFPGDAQIENWEYALFHARDREAIRRLLADVTVYKVGHHGSLNATPKSLWNLFRRKGPGRSARDRLTTLLSTLPGKHGREERGTEVPRQALLRELERQSELVSTHELKGRTLRHDLLIPL